jgi:DNA-binding IclR family transcriptional regulator
MSAPDRPSPGRSSRDPSGRGPATGPGDALVERAFALLGSFDSEHRAQPLAGLARRTGLPRSTVLRLARQLTGVGALERLDDGRFVVGLRLLEVASLAPRGHGLRAVAMPFMEDLFHVTGQHVLLAVRDGDMALLVERLSAHDAVPVRFRVGERMTLATTGVGLVLLAHAPADIQERVIRDFTPGDVGDTVHTADDLRRGLAEIRRGDYAVARRASPRSPRTTVAAPIRTAEGVVAALSVVTPSPEYDPAAYVPAVRAGARAISRQLANAEAPW